MAERYKLLVMFVAVVGVTCIVSNLSGMEAKIYAQDAPATRSSECPLGKDGKCSTDSSRKSKCDKGGCHKISEMMDLARCAKKELLKEKIKANLEEKMGSKLDKIADLLVDAMLDEYKSSMESKAKNTTLEKNIREVFIGTGKQ